MFLPPIKSGSGLNMNAKLLVFPQAQKIPETNFVTASNLTPEPSVPLVTGGAILGFDGQVHIGLDCAHTVLSPDEARHFAAKLNRIAVAMD
jgi:hypothetical protein